MSAIEVAEEAEAQVAADIDAQSPDIYSRRWASSSSRPGALSRYDQACGQQMVVAALHGSRCEGCHLDLSAVELDAVLEACRRLAECLHLAGGCSSSRPCSSGSSGPLS